MSGRERHATPRGKGVKVAAQRSKCPICGKPQEQEFQPFCSKRCADLDLGRWLGGRYAVPGEPLAKDDGETGEDP